jgi:hypothetical protein
MPGLRVPVPPRRAGLDGGSPVTGIPDIIPGDDDAPVRESDFLKRLGQYGEIDDRLIGLARGSLTFEAALAKLLVSKGIITWAELRGQWDAEEARLGRSIPERSL